MNANQSPDQIFQMRSWSHQQTARVRVGVAIRIQA
jgi:catalase